MAAYDINSLAIRNGRLYAGNTEVGPKDTVGGTPVWALNQDRILQLIGQPPDTSNYQGSMFDVMPTDQYAAIRGALPQFAGVSDYYRSQVDPVSEFANVGQNRDALYGAYMVGQNDSPTAGQEDLGIANAWGKAGSYTPLSQGLFDRKSAIPNLATQWSGEEYTPMNEFISPISAQSSKDAQAILKKFYPNVSQADMDKAAYAVMQEGQWYYNGYNQPAVADPGAPYYGHGPLPVVTAIAKKLGGVTPQLTQFFDTNWQTFADNYGEQRHSAKAAAAAETMASTMEGIKGVSMVVGGAFSFANLLQGGLGATLGMDSVASNLGVMGPSIGAPTASGLSWGGVLDKAASGAVKGAIQGGINSAVSGGDVGSGLISGAVRGGLTSGVGSAVSGAAGDLGANPAVAGIAGSIAGSATGGLINAATQPDAPSNSGEPGNSQAPTTTAAPIASPPGNNGLDWGDGFSALLNTNNGNAYGRPEWGERLNNGRAA